MRTAHLCLALVLVPGLALLTGCGETTVTRTDTKAVRDLSGNWNATDARIAAEKMVDASLKGAWIENFTKANNGKNPTVKVGDIKVRVEEVINTSFISDPLLEALINSGKVDVVASKSEAGQAREERKEQDLNASEKTRKASFEEIGADFLIIGEISAQNDQSGTQQQKFYKATLKITDIKTQKIVGLFTQNIAKDVERSDYK